MKTKILLSCMALILMLSAFGQKSTLDLTFTSKNGAAYVPLETIMVINRTQGSDTVIFWPDTTLSLEITPGDLLLFIGYANGYPVGIRQANREENHFHLYQGYPNPVKDQAAISMYIPEKETVKIRVTDVQGRVLNSSAWQLDKGKHFFTFTPGAGNLFFLTAWWKSECQTIKILAVAPNPGISCNLDYSGPCDEVIPLKASNSILDLTTIQSGIVDSPEAGKTYTFEFATNIACPGIPTVTYGGQDYHTIQILSQCWLWESLNIGTMIDGNTEQTDNNIIEKYCYDNIAENCPKYGGLYQWDEMMQYDSIQGGQGICPPGWHVPTDEDWKVLEGASDTLWKIGSVFWDDYGMRGSSAGENLKTTSEWFNNGNGSDLFNFAGWPGGYRYLYGPFFNIGYHGNWWSSTESNSVNAWYRYLDSHYPGAGRSDYSKSYGFSVRCLKY